MNKEIEIEIKLSDGACVPVKGSDGAAAYDLVVKEDTWVGAAGPYEKTHRQIIKTGISMAIPPGYEAEVMGRSGLSVRGMDGESFFLNLDGEEVCDKNGYECFVMTGKIDSDYRGEVGVILRNYGKGFIIPAGLRIAQLTVRPVMDVKWKQVDELSKTDRGVGGFGSTGTK